MATLKLTVANAVELWRGTRRLSLHASEADAVLAAIDWVKARPNQSLTYTLKLRYVGSKVRVFGVLDSVPPPDVPTGLRVVEFSSDFVLLAWNNSADAESWEVYRDEVEIGTSTVATYTDDTVADATLYSYTVVAVNAAGSSAASAAVEVTTSGQGAPATPANFETGEVTAGKVVLLWDPAADAAEWDVLRSDVVIATVTAPGYTDLAVEPETDYDYKLIARNSSGDSAPTTILSVTTLSNAVPQWSMSATQNGALGAAFFLDLNSVCEDSDDEHTVTYSVFSGALPSGLALGGSAITGTYSAVGGFSVTLRADDGFDTSDFAVTWTVVDPDQTAPSVPGSVVAAANGSTVTVTWSASTDASGILKYRVFRDGQFRSDATASPYTELGVANGTYTYSVSAVDDSVNANESAQGSAAPVVVSVVNPVPDAPINFSAFAGDGEISLSWSAGSSGPAPTGYELNRATSDSGPWSSDLLSQANVTSFTDTGLVNGTWYFYRLRAVNGSGSTINANFGNYWMTGRAGPDRGTGSVLANILANGQAYRFDSLYRTQGDPLSVFRSDHLLGVSMEYRWCDLETTQGNYTQGLSYIRAEIDKLKTFTPARRLWIQFRPDKQNQDMTNYTAMFPSYLGPGGLNVVYQYFTDGRNFVSWNINSATAQARHTALWTNIINALKADPEYWDYIEGFRPFHEVGGTRFGNTASVSPPAANNPSVTVTSAQFQAHVLATCELIRGLAPDKAIIINLINSNDKRAFLDALIPLDVLVGHGDAVPRGANGTGDMPTGDKDLIGASPDPFDIDGRVTSALWMGVEGSELGGTAYPTDPDAPPYLIPEMHTYMVDVMQAHYIFWDTWEGPAETEENYEEIMDYIDDNPDVPSGLPAHYGVYTSDYATANATPVAVTAFKPNYPRLGWRQAFSGAPTTNAAQMASIWGVWGPRYHVGFWTGGRNSTWQINNEAPFGTSLTLAELPAWIKSRSTYTGNVMVKYTNNTQIDNVETGFTANEFEYDKCTSERLTLGTAFNDWIIRFPRTAGQISAGDKGTPVSSGANGTDNVLTNFYPYARPDAAGLKWSQWYPRRWYSTASGAALGLPAGDWQEGAVAGAGVGIGEGTWDGVFCDDQSIIAGKAQTTDNADLDGDGDADDKDSAPVIAARAQGFVDSHDEWRYLFGLQPLGTLQYFFGNIAAIMSPADLWPVAMRSLYNGGMAEEITGKSKQYGFGQYNVAQNATTNHTGMMGHVWRCMEYCIEPKMVLCGHEPQPEFRTKWGFPDGVNPSVPPKDQHWITENGVQKFPGKTSDFSDWRLNRYAMGCFSLDDGYITINQTTPTWNTRIPWYDEFNGGVIDGATNGDFANWIGIGWLGQPATGPRGVPQHAAYEQGVWLRMFQNGAVVVNPGRSSSSSFQGNVDNGKTITLPALPTGQRYQRLRASPNGYTTTSSSGPQDTVVNNGALIPTNNQLFIREFDALFLRIVTTGSSATKIVQPNGVGGAFTTLQAALNAMTVNDVIELRSNTAGALTTNTESLTITSKNFSSATMPVIRVRTGDRWLFKGGSGAVPIFKAVNSSWIHFDGNGADTDDDDRREHMEWADPSLWLNNTAPGPYTNTLRGESSHSIFFSRCKVHGNGTSDRANFIRRDCPSWIFRDVEISMHGEPTATGGAGDCLSLFGPRCIIEDSKLKWAGHDILAGYSPWGVYRNIELDGDWTGTGRTYGARHSYDIGTARYDHWSPDVAGQHFGIETSTQFQFGPALMEGWHTHDIASNGTSAIEAAGKIQGAGLIVRECLWADITQGVPLSGPTFDSATDATDGMFPTPAFGAAYIYHCTTYNTRGVWKNSGDGMVSPPNPANSMEEWRFTNNVHGEVHTSIKDAAESAVYWRMQSVQLNSWPNKWKGTQWRGVIFQGDSAKMNFELDDVEQSMASGAAATWPNNISNIQTQSAALGFANASARTLAGLTITSGLGYQDAAHLTLTTAAGVSTTTMPVELASQFYDGENPATWNLAAYGEENDWIAVGTTFGDAVLVQIATVQSKTVLTLKTPISFSSGAKVWFAGNPAMGAIAIRRNRGAGQ